MRYAIRRYRRKWGLFLITDSTDEDGKLLSLHKTPRAAEIEMLKYFNTPANRYPRGTRPARP